MSERTRSRMETKIANCIYNMSFLMAGCGLEWRGVSQTHGLLNNSIDGEVTGLLMHVAGRPLTFLIWGPSPFLCSPRANTQQLDQKHPSKETRRPEGLQRSRVVSIPVSPKSRATFCLLEWPTSLLGMESGGRQQPQKGEQDPAERQPMPATRLPFTHLLL